MSECMCQFCGCSTQRQSEAALQARLAECKRERDKASARLASLAQARILALTPEGLYEFGKAMIAAGWHNAGANVADAANVWKHLRAQLTETQRLLEVQLAVGDKLEAENKRLRALYDDPAKYSCVELEWKAKAKRTEAELAALREACQEVIDRADAAGNGPLWLCGKILRDALGR